MKPQNFTTIQSTKVNPTHLLDEKFGGNSVPVFAALTPGLFSSRNNVQSQYYSLILILLQPCIYQQSNRPVQHSQHLLQKPQWTKYVFSYISTIFTHIIT